MGNKKYIQQDREALLNQHNISVRLSKDGISTASPELEKGRSNPKADKIQIWIIFNVPISYFQIALIKQEVPPIKSDINVDFKNVKLMQGYELTRREENG